MKTHRGGGKRFGGSHCWATWGFTELNRQRGFKAVHLYIIRCNPPSKDFSKDSHYVSSLWKAEVSLKYVTDLDRTLKQDSMPTIWAACNRVTK